MVIFRLHSYFTCGEMLSIEWRAAMHKLDTDFFIDVSFEGLKVAICLFFGCLIAQALGLL